MKDWSLYDFEKNPSFVRVTISGNDDEGHFLADYHLEVGDKEFEALERGASVRVEEEIVFIELFGVEVGFKKLSECLNFRVIDPKYKNGINCPSIDEAEAVDCLQKEGHVVQFLVPYCIECNKAMEAGETMFTFFCGNCGAGIEMRQVKG